MRSGPAYEMQPRTMILPSQCSLRSGHAGSARDVRLESFLCQELLGYGGQPGNVRDPFL
jgi:hypothetical protein